MRKADCGLLIAECENRNIKSEASIPQSEIGIPQ